MPFSILGDVVRCANFAYKLYTYGWSKAKNATAQYTEFGKDVCRLHQNLLQLVEVFRNVETSTGGKIPEHSDFFNTSSLNSILDDPFSTITECRLLLRRRDSFAEESGAIQNIFWNARIEADVTQLHNRIKFHNVKILVLIKPFELKLLLDVQTLVRDYGKELLLRLSQLEARIFGDAEAVSSVQAVRCRQIQIPNFLIQKFEAASKAARPELQDNDIFPMHDGINAFLIHHKEDEAHSKYTEELFLQPPTQSPEQYLRMIKSIWIIQKVQGCSEYITACQSGDRLLMCFVDELDQKCLKEFNRFAESPPQNPFKVRHEPNELTLNKLGDAAFSIWPTIARPLDRFDAACMDSLKIILRAPLQPLLPSRRLELLLLRHDDIGLEMMIKETSEVNSGKDTRSTPVDLKIVSLNPLYADPITESSALELGLYPCGNRGRDDLLSFRTYRDLYQFQGAITGYRPIIDLSDIDLAIQQDKKRTEWCVRVQLWESHKPELGEVRDPNSPSIARRLSDAPSQLSSTNSPSGQSSSNQASQCSSMPTSYSSTTRLMSVTSLMENDHDGGLGIEVNLFEPPKPPLLVLFLRPSGKRSFQHQSNHLSLMKISIAEESALLETSNCTCVRSERQLCTHSGVKGVTFCGLTRSLLAQHYRDTARMNMALLGAYHEDKDSQLKEKLNFISLRFKSPNNKKTFDGSFRQQQRLHRIREYPSQQGPAEYGNLSGSDSILQTHFWTVATYAIKACQDMSRDYNQLLALIGETGTFLKTLQIIEEHFPDCPQYAECVTEAFTAILMVFAIQTRYMYDGRALKFLHSLTSGADEKLSRAYGDVTAAIDRLSRANPDGKVVASASDDKTVRLWDAVMGAALQMLELSITARTLSFSTSGQYLKTDRGVLDVRSLKLSSDPLEQLRTLFVLNDWIAEEGTNILWLPHNYRATCVAMWDGMVVLGHSLRRISFLELLARL